MISGTQARDAINSIRAAGDFKEVGAGKKAMIYGWSQGGGSVLTAASLPEYIAQTGTAFDGIELLGFVAMAPPDVAANIATRPTDPVMAEKFIGSLLQSFSANVMDFAHASMTFWAVPNGFSNTKLNDLFTDDGAKAINAIYTGKCIHTAADTLSYNFGDNYKSLLKPQPQNTLAWAQALYDSGVPKVKPVAPVIIFWGTKDTAVPPVMGDLYRQQMCKLGANVTRIQLPGEQTHYTTPPVAEPLYLPWMADRFAGKPIANGCATAN
jgi:dienelactone hydrolase